MSSHNYGDALGGDSDGKDQDQAVPAAAGANAAVVGAAGGVGGAAPNAEGKGEGEQDFCGWLVSKNPSLGQYVPIFVDEGFDEVEFASNMDADDRESLLAKLDKKPHRKKMAKVLAALCDGGDGGGGDEGDGGDVDAKTWLASIHKALIPYAKVLTDMGYDNFDLIRDIDAGDRDDILAALDTTEIKTVSKARLVITLR